MGIEFGDGWIMGRTYQSCETQTTFVMPSPLRMSRTSSASAFRRNSFGSSGFEVPPAPSRSGATMPYPSGWKNAIWRRQSYEVEGKPWRKRRTGFCCCEAEAGGEK